MGSDKLKTKTQHPHILVGTPTNPVGPDTLKVDKTTALPNLRSFAKRAAANPWVVATPLQITDISDSTRTEPHLLQAMLIPLSKTRILPWGKITT